MKGGRGGRKMAREYKQEKRTLNMCMKSLLHVYVEHYVVVDVTWSLAIFP